MPLTKLRILTDRMTGAERRFGLRTMVAVSSLPLFGVVAAFGLAPDTDTLNINTETVIQAIALPAIANQGFDGTFEREVLIQSGDTLASALARMNIDALEIQRLMADKTTRQVTASIRAGKRLRASTTHDGQLVAVTFDRGDATATIKRLGDAYVLDEIDAVRESRVVMRSGRIVSSLYGATDSAGIPDKIANQLAETFSTSIDFREDLRRGDTFSVIYTVDYVNGEPVAAGKLLAAEFVNAGKPYRALMYRDGSGRDGYYTPEGESLKKGFLRSPLEFSRVTSSFSNSRKHPVYGFHRAHTGVDFGAPTGTRVKATGDATVVFAGSRGGYGNLVVLRHQNGYETYYAHLSKFASGIKPGRRVGQGDVIAFVGSTGASTGPHLHYEVRISGRPQNPMAIKLPGSPPLAAAQRAKFLEQTAGWADKLAMLRGTNLAALD